jgi:hypothetical protein
MHINSEKKKSNTNNIFKSVSSAANRWFNRISPDWDENEIDITSNENNIINKLKNDIVNKNKLLESYNQTIINLQNLNEKNNRDFEIERSEMMNTLWSTKLPKQNETTAIDINLLIKKNEELSIKLLHANQNISMLQNKLSLISSAPIIPHVTIAKPDSTMITNKKSNNNYGISNTINILKSKIKLLSDLLSNIIRTMQVHPTYSTYVDPDENLDTLVVDDIEDTFEQPYRIPPMHPDEAMYALEDISNENNFDSMGKFIPPVRRSKKSNSTTSIQSDHINSSNNNDINSINEINSIISTPQKKERKRKNDESIGSGDDSTLLSTVDKKEKIKKVVSIKRDPSLPLGTTDKKEKKKINNLIKGDESALLITEGKKEKKIKKDLSIKGDKTVVEKKTKKKDLLK